MSQNSQENTCVRVSFLIKLQAEAFIKKLCEISKNTFFTEHLWWLLLSFLNISLVYFSVLVCANLTLSEQSFLEQNILKLLIKFAQTTNFKSSHRRCSVRKGVLRNVVKFTGKYLCQSLFFNKVAGLRLATLLRNKLRHKCFPVNFTKFLRTPFSIKHLWWLLSNFR